MTEDLILNPNRTDDETEEQTFRPKSLQEFIGQKDVVDELSTWLQSAKSRKRVLEHILLSGPPGLGKTTIANLLANEMGNRCISINGPTLKDANEVVSILISLNRGDILFIDEIHGLKKSITEIFYPAMEDFKIPFTRMVGNKKEHYSIKLKSFTLVGATTKSGVLSAPFRSRFGIFLKLKPYTNEELIEVVNRTCSMSNIPINHDAVCSIASRSRGTPRVANRLVRRVRDVMIVKGAKEINKKIANVAFAIMKIDDLGLGELDRRILFNIHKIYHNGPVGIKLIAASVGEEVSTIEDEHEPFLTDIGFLKLTKSGREVTFEALEHLRKLDNRFGKKYDLNIRKKEENNEEIKKTDKIVYI
jgi:Holliday junction DNA helicase RuvB